MTPKEKAIELVKKFSAVGLQQRGESIVCAIIAVEEIIDTHLYDLDKKEYWQQVKEEIIYL